MEKSSTDGYIILLLGYAQSLFRDFESNLRNVAAPDEDDTRLILKQYNEKSITCQLCPGIYTIKAIAEAVHTVYDHEGTLENDYDVINMRTKPVSKRFRGTFETLRL